MKALNLLSQIIHKFNGLGRARPSASWAMQPNDSADRAMSHQALIAFIRQNNAQLRGMDPRAAEGLSPAQLVEIGEIPRMNGHLVSEDISSWLLKHVRAGLAVPRVAPAKLTLAASTNPPRTSTPMSAEPVLIEGNPQIDWSMVDGAIPFQGLGHGSDADKWVPVVEARTQEVMQQITSMRDDHDVGIALSRMNPTVRAVRKVLDEVAPEGLYDAERPSRRSGHNMYTTPYSTAVAHAHGRLHDFAMMFADVAAGAIKVDTPEQQEAFAAEYGVRMKEMAGFETDLASMGITFEQLKTSDFWAELLERKYRAMASFRVGKVNGSFAYEPPAAVARTTLPVRVTSIMHVSATLGGAPRRQWSEYGTKGRSTRSHETTSALSMIGDEVTVAMALAPYRRPERPEGRFDGGAAIEMASL